jgi:hypothetical protein
MDIQQNQSSWKEDLLKQAEAEARDQTTALQTSEEILNKHVELLMQVVRQYNVDPRNLISSNVQGISMLPQQMRAEIAKLQVKMRVIIDATAERIEDRNYRPLQDVIDDKFQILRQKEQANKLITAEKTINISIQTLRLTTSNFVELNNWILGHLKEAERQQNSSMAREAVLANAIVVYELCDYVIRFIEKFQVAGLGELKALKKEVESARRRFRQSMEMRKKQAESQTASAAQRRAALEHIQRYEEVLQKREGAWETYWKRIEEVNNGTQDYMQKLPDLRLMRDLAGDRLDFITLMDLDTFISSSLQNLELTADDIVSKLDMPAMTPSLFELLYEGDM